jgi:hypothetical protein
VSLSPSTTRRFDAPEFIFTLRCGHSTRGHCFCPRILYSLNPPFWPISGTLQLPVSWCYTSGVAICQYLSQIFAKFLHEIKIRVPKVFDYFPKYHTELRTVPVYSLRSINRVGDASLLSKTQDKAQIILDIYFEEYGT